MTRCKRSLLFCFPLWLLTWGSGYCQNTRGSLGIPKVAPSMLPATLADLNHTTDDTTEIRLLIKLSCIYYWQDQTRHHYFGVDSAVFFAQQAMSLSSRINFTEGLTESEFLLCRILI